MTELHTFSATYGKGIKGDESTFIEEYDKLVQNMHFIKPTADSFFNDIDEFITALVEPVPNTSEYAEYKVMELAKNYATVILNGQGADEALAGYLYMAGFLYKELLSSFRLLKLIKSICFDIKKHHSLEGVLASIYFLSPKTIKNELSYLKNSYIKKDFKNEYKGSDVILESLYNSKTLHDSIVNHFEYKFEHHLLWADRSAMWFSLESRFPFLDHSLLEKVLNLKNEFIINEGGTKFILRESMKDYLPEKIRLRQDKVGYETPENDWFRAKKNKILILDIICSQDFKNRGYFNSSKCEKLYNKHLKGDLNIAPVIWKWINLELWFKKFFDKCR